MGNHETIDGSPLPIDLGHLSRYTVNDPEVTRDVLKIFHDQGDGWLSGLAEAADIEAWRDTAHAMKGAARGVGAHELALLAEEAEDLPSLEASERAELFVRVEQALTRAKRYAAQLLEDSPFVG